MKRADVQKWPLAAHDLGIDHLNSAEPLVAVLQCHLRMEGLLADLLVTELPTASALDFQRLGFAQLARIAAATEIVPSFCLPALLTLNKVRNRLAHERDAGVDASDVERLQADLRPLNLGESFLLEGASVHGNFALLVMGMMAWLNAFHTRRALLRERPELAEQPDELSRELERIRDERYPSVAQRDG